MVIGTSDWIRSYCIRRMRIKKSSGPTVSRSNANFLGRERGKGPYAIWPTPRNHRICTADFWCVDKKKEKSKYVVHMHINKCHSFNNQFAQLTYCWNFVWWVGSLKNRLTINLIEVNWGVCLVDIQISI